MRQLRITIWVLLFAVAFAFVEAAVVVYLRGLYYPGGFTFPLKLVSNQHIAVELAREAATLAMLVTVGILAGRTRWQRTGFFMLAFGVWDLFFYLWLKLVLDWPVTLFDWDILFLIPLPWIGPVIAPVAISVLLVVAGLWIIRTEHQQGVFKPPKLAWALAGVATVVILISFMMDTNATLRLQMPEPYRYELLVVGLVLYIAGMVLSFRRRKGGGEGRA